MNDKARLDLANKKLEYEGLSREKQDILEKAGFIFDLDRGLYIHFKKRIIISFHAIAFYDEKWLKENTERKEKNRKWEFGFVVDPAPSIKKEITSRYEPQHVTDGVSNLFGG